MEEYKKILKIAAYLLEYPDAAWWEEFSEYRAAAQELKNQQTREVFHDLFDYVEGVGAKEYEQDYVRKFDFSQNTNLYLTTHNRTDFGKQSTEMHDFKQLFLDNGYDLQKELPDYLPALLELAITVEPAQAKKMAAISDGAIVGSAIIKILVKHGEAAPKLIGEYVREMKDAVKNFELIMMIPRRLIFGSAIIKILAKHGEAAPKLIGEYVREMKDAVKILN